MIKSLIGYLKEILTMTSTKGRQIAALQKRRKQIEAEHKYLLGNRLIKNLNFTQKKVYAEWSKILKHIAELTVPIRVVSQEPRRHRNFIK